MLIDICMKFHEDSFYGFQFIDRTGFCDKQNGRTDIRGKQYRRFSSNVF